MHLILLGPPGSGKGTQGAQLAEHYGATHISSGELLRQHLADRTPLGTRVEDYVRAGQLVPDEIVLALLQEPIERAAAAGGYVLDGFPRTLRQAELCFAEASAKGIAADAVVFYAVPDDVVRRRLSGRAALGRADDAEEAVIERRLRLFHDETETLLDYYRRRGVLVTVPADRPPDEVFEATIKALDGR